MDEDFFQLIDSFVPHFTREPKDSVSFNETVELFVQSTVNDIMTEDEETPRFNIMFSTDAIDWLRELLKTPLKKWLLDTKYDRKGYRKIVYRKSK